MEFHLSGADRLEGAYLQVTWMRHARQLLLMIEPGLNPEYSGVLGQAWRDVSGALDAVDAAEDDVNFSHVVERHYLDAVATLRSVEDCALFAPDSLGVANTSNPYFFDLPRPPQGAFAFVLMPFEEAWSEEYWSRRVKRVIEGLPVSPRLASKRADDLFGHDVLLDIVAAIRAATVVVGDITGRNPNVFYELGIAHQIGKRVILTTQAASDIPFDLQRFRHIIYDTSDAGWTKLERDLKSTLLEILG